MVNMSRQRKRGLYGNDLSYKIARIKNVFDLEHIQNLHPDNRYVQEYYRANRLAYSLFHTFSDNVHMGISRDGHYKQDDLHEGARIVERYIVELGAGRVVELATGRGATSSYLAERFPDVTFHGIDFSPDQLDLALKKARKLRNYRPALGDYHDLSRFEDDSVDIAFEIEAVCHSEDKQRVFQEVWRILKQGGGLCSIRWVFREE